MNYDSKTDYRRPAALLVVLSPQTPAQNSRQPLVQVAVRAARYWT